MFLVPKTFFAPKGAVADFRFTSALASWTTGRTGFGSAFATDEWLMQDASSPLANNVGSETLSNDSGLVDQEWPVIHDGTAYGNRKSWESRAGAGSDTLVASGTTAGDSDGEDLAGRVTFAQLVTPGDGDYLVSKIGASGPGWSVGYVSGAWQFRITDGTNTATVSLSADLSDGAAHYLSWWYDESADLIYLKSDLEAESSASSAAVTGSLSNAIALQVSGTNGAAATDGMPSTKVAPVSICVGLDAPAHYTELFWRHALDPSSLLTETDRECPISVPLSASTLGTFGGSDTLGRCQLPIGYAAEFTTEDAPYGLQGNGVYTNSITYSEALSNWTQSGTSTTVDNSADGPSGFRNASKITAGADNDTITSNVFATTASWWYGMGIWIKEVVGSEGATGRIIFYNESGAAIEGATVFTATGDWQFIDFSDRATAGGVNMSVKIEIDTNGDEIYASCAQVAKSFRVTTAMPYLRTAGSAAVSVDGAYRCSTAVVKAKRGEIRTVFRLAGAATGKFLYQFPNNTLLNGGYAGMSNAALLARVYDNAVAIEDSISAVANLGNGGAEIVMRHIWDDSAGGDMTGGYESAVVVNGVTTNGAAAPSEGTRDLATHSIGIATTNVGEGENFHIARLQVFNELSEAIP